MTTHDPETTAQEMLHRFDDGTFHAGSAEPWIADVLATLLIANGTRTAIEIGCFEGRTSRRIVQALDKLPWPTTFTGCEIDANRAALVERAIDFHRSDRLTARVLVANSHDWIPTLPDASVDFAWVDGNHEQPHVYRELHLLAPKMAPGGIIAGHDVYGVCELHAVFDAVRNQLSWQGMSLDLPRLGPAGGIGLLQRPR